MKAAGKAFRKSLSGMQDSQRADLKSLLTVLGQEEDGCLEEVDHARESGHTQRESFEGATLRMPFGSSRVAAPGPGGAGAGGDDLWWHEHAQMDPMQMWRQVFHGQGELGDGEDAGKDCAGEPSTLAARIGWPLRGAGPGRSGVGRDREGGLEMVALAGSSQVCVLLLLFTAGHLRARDGWCCQRQQVQSAGAPPL